MLLKLAIDANIPLISVRTTDTVHIISQLKEISGRKVFAYKNGDKVNPKQIYCYHHDKLQLIAPETLYRQLQDKDSCMVVVNPVEQSPVFYNAGLMPILRESIMAFLVEYMSEKDAKMLIRCLGGLNLKEVAEVLMITSARDGHVSTKGIIQTRKYYLNKIQGLEMVDTDLHSYLPDARLKDFADKQKPFFLNGPDSRLCPRGLIAYGEPGTGKSMGAKYLASQWGVPLYRLDATVQSKWVGESELNLHNALLHLENEAPCILMLDEIEKLFGQSTDAGVTQKMMGTLLWWLQEHSGRILTYMTCNKIDALPPELYRSGRIDQELEFKGLKIKPAIALGDFILKTYPNKLQGPARSKFKAEIGKKQGILTHAEVDSLVKNSIKYAYLGAKAKN